MQGDLISRDFSVKALREYAEQKHAVGQTELANGILKAINFLQKEENVPTAYSVEKVVAGIRRSSGNGYRDIDGDYVPPMIATKDAIEIVRNGGKE